MQGLRSCSSSSHIHSLALNKVPLKKHRLLQPPLAPQSSAFLEAAAAINHPCIFDKAAVDTEMT